MPDPTREEEQSFDDCDYNQEDWYDEDYYMAIVNIADEIDHSWGHCYNCLNEGHQWRDCTQQLKESLRLAKERLDRKNKALNRDRGAGAKGGQPPQVGFAKAHTAKAKN